MSTHSSDPELLAAFESGKIACESWNHRAHVRVAFLYAQDHGLEEAIHRMRTGLQALNAIHQVPDAPGRGYHETITVAFLRLICSALRHHAPATSDDFCQRHPELLNKSILDHFYSHELLSTATAKSSFLEPDLAPLPND